MCGVKLASRTDAEIDRQQHQSGAVDERDREGPKRKLGRADSREHARVVTVQQAKDAEGDDETGCADSDLPLPVEERQHDGEGQ